MGCVPRVRDACNEAILATSHTEADVILQALLHNTHQLHLPFNGHHQLIDIQSIISSRLVTYTLVANILEDSTDGIFACLLPEQ